MSGIDVDADLKHPSPDKPSSYEIYETDARDIPIKDNSVDLVVTSPPYYQKRDYGFEEQIGQEESVPEFVEELMKGVREWQRVLILKNATSDPLFVKPSLLYHNV